MTTQYGDDNRPRNQNRVDLYSLLPPEIVEEDQKTGHITYLDYWDSTDYGGVEEWDEANAIWDRTGYSPVIQSLFWVIEQESGEDLVALEDLADLRDPDKTPAQFLPIMARSLGHALEEGLSEKKQRETVKAISALNKIRGKPLSWIVFYRMVGFRIVQWPLWKKDVHEAEDRYSRERYASVNPISGEVLTSVPIGYLASNPIRPTSLRITDGVEIFRDDGKGVLIGNQGGDGVITYRTGAYRVNFATPPAGAVTASYDEVTDEYPYHAARVDLDLFLVPIEGEEIAVVDDAFVQNILERIEEVRPIHVLVRALSFIVELEDEVLNFANDEPPCGPQMGIDHWEGKEDFYAADLGPVSDDDILQISRSDGYEEFVFEDIARLVCPARDILRIESTPPQAHDGDW